MVEAAYPEGMSDDLLLPLLRALSDHMTEGELGHVLAQLSHRPVSLRSVAKATQLSKDDPAVQDIMERLRPHGYEEWAAEIG
jgi:hypothetical protein